MNKDRTNEKLQKHEEQLYQANLRLLGLSKEKDCSSKPYVDSFIQTIQKKASGVTFPGLPSGFTEIDNQTGGWKEAEFIVVAGNPTLGKTAFLLTMAKYLAIVKEQPIAYLSLAQRGECLISRLVSSICDISYEEMKNSQFTNDEWEKIGKATELISKSPLYINDTPGLSVFDIKTIGRYLIREKGIKLMMIDNLQLINVGNGNANSRQEEYLYINQELKNFSLELNIPVVVICETLPSDDTERDLLERAHGFGAIEQFADTVLFLQHPAQRHLDLENETLSLNDTIEVVFAKCRNGQTFPVTLCFRSDYSRFENVGIPQSGKEASDDDIPF